MREKRVKLVVLLCSVLVATCASVSCFVTADQSNLNFNNYKYAAAVISSIVFTGQISLGSAATVWIPTEPAIDTDGSVKDEFAEVAHVFARPEAKVVKPKPEDEITQQPVPWTSLKNEWSIYQKIQNGGLKKKKGENKEQIKKAVQGEESEKEKAADDDGSSEEDEDEEEDEEEEDEPEARSSGGMMMMVDDGEGDRKKVRPRPPVKQQTAQAKKDSLPLAFYGQQNHDDDEREYLKDEAKIYTKKQKSDSEDEKSEEEDQDDQGDSKEAAASVEDYDDYAVDDDEDDKDGKKNQQQQQRQKPRPSFEDIPLAIREMILNDLANQNNGSGYYPSLTPKVVGGSLTSFGASPTAKVLPKTKSAESGENDDGDEEENSSEEAEEDDQGEGQGGQNKPPPPELMDTPLAPHLLAEGADPTPPAIGPEPEEEPKKGDDDEDEVYDDDGGKGKGKGKGKKKKGKKGGHGWGWKPKGWGQVHIAPGWGHDHHHHKGWGWDPHKHDGVLEQMVKGSTWERVLKYYHWKRDQALHEEKDGHHHHDDGHHHHESHHPGSPHPQHDESVGWGWDGGDHESGIKKIVKGAFKGSFWERAVHTYAAYKENQAKNPKKPLHVSLDSGHPH